MSKELNKAPVEQAGGDERAVDGKPRATKCPDCGEGDLMPGDLCACGYETDPAAGYACSECDGSGDGYVGEVCRECDGSGWFVTPEQARAALAQPSPKCATCNGSGQVWISDEPQRHFEDCPDCAQPSLAPTEGFIHFPELLESVQQMDAMLKAEAERPELWAVHAQGSDELYAAFSREDAEKHAAELNALPMPEGIAVGAVVVPSPWPEAEHWKYLAEQERDHKNEIAVRLRQFERICEGLPQDAIDGGWTVQGIRGYAKRLEDQLKAAQAQHSMPGEFIGRLSEFLAQRGATGKALLRELRTMLAAAPGNSAQHSVPELLEWAVGRWHAEVSLRPLINVHRRALDDTWRQVIRRLGGDTGLLCGPSHDELLAAAPAQGGE
ncbi:hypothetical protein [Pseudomonas aeruginosa]|uniref:hypothetical protein n=1 Tax=Pseudomonas aeruginosa TaxID=287 RepID=UPI002A7595E4|nr:hypothetical protein [Pseudomonas aeruginosa]MDY1583318.1 hypothetical protein [Pseudomonas aeruginosa]HCE5819534.1 hypothetical protein [Pseudomonas aeruginosa]